MFLKSSCVQWPVSSDRARVPNVYFNFAYMNINCPLFRPFPFLWNPPYLFTFWWRLKSSHPPFHSFTDAPTQILPGQVIESLQCPIHKCIKGSLSVWFTLKILHKWTILRENPLTISITLNKSEILMTKIQ